MSVQITRRAFAGMCAAFSVFPAQQTPSPQHPGDRVYDIFGVPFRAGSLYPGTENDAAAYRQAGLVDQMGAAGICVADCGDIPIPSFLPHHNIPPIRNWPAPRIVWDCVSEQIHPSLKQPGHVPLLIGCDCSIVVGTVQALRNAGSKSVHVLYFDGDFDDAAPEPQVCNSAASFATWLLTSPSPFWSGPQLDHSQLTIVGWSVGSKARGQQSASISLAEIRGAGVNRLAGRILESIPSSADILIHLDIDVLAKQEMPAAYFQHRDGLTLAECAELLGPIARDSRVRLIEISEYATLRDLSGIYMQALIALLTRALR
ncbi:MAG TPA: arginase family protein [Acidobacteriaceae bacterium]|nr:arginase family protein [Acidobacteriaceae bacterium]